MRRAARILVMSMAIQGVLGLLGRLPRRSNIFRGLFSAEPSLDQLDLSVSSEDSLRRNGDSEAVFVCTGASRGLGWEFSRQLLERTAGRVVGVTRGASKADGPSVLKQAYGGRYETVEAELTSSVEISTLPAQLLERGIERVDLLVNAAGVLHGTLPGEAEVRMPERSLSMVTPEWMEFNFQLNTMAPLLVAKALAPMMKTKGQSDRPPSIIANLSARVGSIADNRLGGWYSYRISKAAQNMVTRNLSLELKRQGTLVVGLHPGTVDTGLSKPFQKNVAHEKLFTPEYSVAQLLSILDVIEQQHTGEVFAWDGAKIPY